MGTRTSGFASMTAERREEVARSGGLAAQEAGTAHRFTAEEARRAGKKSADSRRKKKGRKT